MRLHAEAVVSLHVVSRWRPDLPDQQRRRTGIALPSARCAWLFAGSDRWNERAAAMFTLTETAKLNNVEPEAWFADVLRRSNDHPAARLGEILPWNWKDRPAKLAG
jgi:hypothetical protein